MNLGPHVYIVSGSKARQIVGNLLVSFTVSAFDREDGRLEGTNVVWRSSVCGLLGTGSALSLMADTLSEGRHVITVTAKDRNGRTGGATTEVTIVRDTDADGLADAWELQYFGNLLAGDRNADPDHDGLANIEEYQMGRNPILFDNLRLDLGVLQTNGVFQLSLYGEVGRNCTLEVSTNLLYWQSLAHLACTSLPTIYTDRGRSNYPRRFYRIAPLSQSVSRAVTLAAESLSSSGLALRVQGPPALNCRIEASSNLVQWSPLTTFITTGSTTCLLDASTTTRPRRFYRAVLP